MKFADYCVTKLSLTESGMIDNITLYRDLGGFLDIELLQKDRNWMVQQINKGKSFCSIKKDESGMWNKIGDFIYNGSIFKWYIIPENIARRKTFVSYYHHDDELYRNQFENLFNDLIVSKSVKKDEIDSNNSDEYIKQLIQKGYLADTTVLVVLVGPKTKCRMHVDWEISGAISTKVGGNSGLLGILLPSHPDYGNEKYDAKNLPARLAENVKSGYALLRDWTSDRVQMQKWIEEAFANKSKVDNRITTSIPQMKNNTCK